MLLAVGDVSGKGAGAALLMANVRASLRTISGTDVGLAEAVFRLNQLLCNDTASDQFVTLFVGVFDPASGIVTYVNAGHNAPRIIRKNGAVEQLDAQSIVLGVFPTVVFAEQAVHLQTGDLIVAFTDGVSEAMDVHEEEFGESRIVEIITQQIDAPVDQVVTAVQRSVEAHVGGVEFADDFTLVVARVR